ncbi:BREX-1 system adenine-specific DNA-methyltransferase PglX, partial [Phascolarctobacterium succinatutens]|uniref:BREX-1 system adenine-specific DNA-methyltransferase PglX n=1 Tax=Phascolarctobacterium succinatutens TaxID=626940 RepID=UPI0026EB40DD
MDKNAIKKFAVWARKELIERVSKKALAYGITEHEVYNPDADSVNGLVLTAAQKKERKALTEQIFAKGYKQVMEEVAYTWFNRFCALRFMEVNGFLPSLVRVFTNDKNEFRPQLLTEALELDLPGLDKQKIYELKEANADEELYKYLLITQCNALNNELPCMFQRIEDYTELLFPDNLLREGSVIEQMITLIPEKDWQDAVQIIGWLYQYYNIEPKKEVFANLDKNIKIGKNDIPAATQLFTPDWIVRYMVENSLGRLVNNASSDNAQPTTTNYPLESWKYYLPEAEQETEVRKQLAQLSTTNFSLTTTKCIDPCMGSGHILAYLFDVLMEVYRSEGYRDRDAVKNIINNNLYGLDIDERAAQLAYFAVMMQGRKYDNRFLTRHYQPHIYAVTESNGINRELLAYFGVELDDLNRENALNQLNGMLDEMEDACEYGSLITVSEYDFTLLKDFVAAYDAEQNLFASGALAPLQERLQQLIAVAEMLAQKYEVVVTNPPYMGAGNMDEKLSKYVKQHYPDSKSDLFAVFMEACHNMTAENGYQAMITMHSWMFLSSFEKLRAKIQKQNLVNMVHLGARAFEEIGGEVVQTTSFVLANKHIDGYKGTYCRLVEPTTQAGKEEMFLAKENRYVACSDNFAKIPGAPVAYWAGNNLFSSFDNDKIVDHYVVRNGISTGNNERYLRLWYEVDNVCEYWIPCNKGGSYRKWYGNNAFVVFWKDNGHLIRTSLDDKGRIKARLGGIEYS